MSEMALTAEHLIVIDQGSLIADQTVADFVARAGLNTALVRSPQLSDLHDLLAGPDVTIISGERGAFEVSGLDAGQIADRAAAAGITLHELSRRQASPEEAFLHLISDPADHEGPAR
jgi:ABC-2 type transport system ATP-binding protein